MSDYHINLLIPEYAYLFGFLQADGHLYENTRNRGKLTVEIGVTDIWLLEQFAQLVPFYSSIKTRTRSTNFSIAYTSAVWSVHNRAFRDALTEIGFPVGRKSDSITVPDREFASVDYFRGIVDADGSLGITAEGLPFVSLITASENLAMRYTAFLYEKIGCQKQVQRNKRDKVFNITVFREEAQVLASVLYYDDCLALPRKMRKVPYIANWQRPPNMKKIYRRVWSEEQDNYILTHTVEESAQHLGRTPQSIKMRLWRYKQAW